MRHADRRPARLPSRSTLLAAAVAAGLAGCASKGQLPGDDAPTLKSLEGRQVAVTRATRIKSSEEKALQAWRDLLAAGPSAPQRAQALRRLGDLEMDSTDTRLAASDAGSGNPDYGKAIAGYRDYLKAYPKDPDNDRVLYQLARAHEQGGDLDAALKVLDQLVAAYPATRYQDEAQFRRGELLFTARKYADAEKAYATVLASAQANPYRERALYMQGWSQFKLARLEPALESFLSVLDIKLAGRDDAVPLEELPDLSRADRELVEDSFRVVSLAFENLQGAASIPPVVKTPERQSYEVRIYQQLAALYLKQDRPKDAADTYTAFVALHPLHAQAPVLQAEVIEIDAKSGFDQLALQAKKDFVARYGLTGAFRTANPAAWERTQPLVKTHLAELARHFHAAAQKGHNPADVQEAVRWYQALLEAFPADADAAQNNFLLAELLFEDKRYDTAATEYEKSAYGYAAHARSADAGYAALLAHAQLAQQAGPDTAAARRRAGVASGLRFAKAFPADSRATAVLTNAADTLYQLGEAGPAAEVAQQVLAAKPEAPAEQRRVAWTVLSHTAFEAGRFAEAERNTAEVLALTAAATAGRGGLVDRLAASIYKQGEQAREAGKSREAAELFARVGDAAPNSAVRVNAQFDAATQLLTLKDWPAAARSLEDFRQRFPKDALQAQVPAKLALAYTEMGQWAPAAAEFERIAQAETQPERARAALWQSAELYDKAAAQPNPAATARASAAKAWERYLRAHPAPLVPAIEARARLADIAKLDGNGARELAWQRELFQAEQAGGAERTARTRTLGAQAALALAAPEFEAYRQVALVEPLQKQLKLKKEKLETALKAYAVAADYGVAEVVTAATFHTAAIYQDFGKALLTSQRPKKLSKTELEQYDVLLEEQAFPFEEKATELHEINARRASEGVYDAWVQQSFAALRALRPVRYGKTERADAAASGSATVLNQQAIAHRQKGEFDQARQAYEQALSQESGYATAVLNLGVLYDLYLGDSARALTQYESYLALSPAGDPVVSKWVAELKNRKPPASAALR